MDKQKKAGRAELIDDEIDLIDLLLTLWSHRAKFFLGGVIGLMLGLAYGFNQPAEYETQLKINSTHPIINPSVINNTSEISRWLAETDFDHDSKTKLTYSPKEDVYTLISPDKEGSKALIKKFTAALTGYAENIKKIALTVNGLNSNLLITDSSKIISWTNQDIANLDTQAVIDAFTFTFGPTEQAMPRPVKYGGLGIFFGIIFGFAWMIINTLATQLKKKR